MHDIGVKIRTARERKGLSRKAFGDLVGISEPKVQAIEIGKQRVDHETLYNIAKLAQLDVLWLLSLEPRSEEETAEYSDRDRLLLAIEAVEEGLEAFERKATPQVKAGLIAAAYELLEQEGEGATAQIIRLVKMA
ncbi:helix-turn-helix transcriptional regulator [Leisingera sp. MMG026]|uniref:helix-turn-helix domain-containing protein n=1 Tax=Leisingera sp. MMG026 TaxID=2909982 RepID=UPI001F1D855E|nr:helix-turn-helix transcriptional regulator [Leisingera sp. MMG026]MCF6432938.1 helix-turn-helix domain-containing protein [Leisingera sp. MMG026]